MARSPIEDALLDALVAYRPADVSVTLFNNKLTEFRARGGVPRICYRDDVPVAEFTEDELAHWAAAAPPDNEDDASSRVLAVYANYPILTYRIDIAVDIGCGVIAIECDGHDFHERTKQQAAYDRSRDRELLIAGVPTLRFTGSEIVHAVERCTSEVYALIEKLWRKHASIRDAMERDFRTGWDCAEKHLAQPSGIEEHW